MEATATEITIATKEASTTLERPDITNPQVFNTWLDRYVDTPFAGASGKTHPDGTPNLSQRTN